MALKSTAHLGRVSKGGFENGEKEFLGEQIRGSLNNNNLRVNNLSKSLKLEKKESKIKPGVAFSVITTENGKETLVKLISFYSLGHVLLQLMPQ